MKDKWVRRGKALEILPVDRSYLAQLAREGKLVARRGERNCWKYSVKSLYSYLEKYRFANGGGKRWGEKELEKLGQGETPKGRSSLAAKIKKSRQKQHRHKCLTRKESI